MKYKKYELGPFNLHLIKTDRFKTITVEILFKRKLKKEEYPFRGLLSEILGITSKKFPTIREMKIEKENLYSLSTHIYQFNNGNYNFLDFTARFLNEKYTEPGMNKKSIEFLIDLILNPNVENGEFNLENFANAKKTLIDLVTKTIESSERYSYIRLIEEMDKDAPYAFIPSEFLENLEKVTPKSLYDYYQTVLKKDFIDIFVVGDIDYSTLKKIFMDSFKINTLKKKTNDHIVKHTKFRKRAKKVTEKSNFNQSKLKIGIKLGSLSDFEQNYVASIYTNILGGGADSKLFKTVREKHSYCYQIGAFYRKVDNHIIISSGIDKENASNVIKLIKKEMKNMVDGKFLEEDIKKAISIYISTIESFLDNPNGIIDYFFMLEYLNPDPIEKRIEKIQKVTKKDIMAFAKKVKIDTIYLLEGEAHEEN